MEQQQIPESNAQKFMKSPAGMVVGVVLALGLGILLLYLGIFNQCCGLGYLLVAVVALYIPKMFGMTKTQQLCRVQRAHRSNRQGTGAEGTECGVRDGFRTRHKADERGIQGEIPEHQGTP